MEPQETRIQKRERIFKTIENYLSSEITQKEFCHKNNLNPHNFQYWLKRHRKQNQTTTTRTRETAPENFIPIRPSSITTTPYPCVIEYPNGLRLMLEKLDIDMFRELLNLTGV